MQIYSLRDRLTGILRCRLRGRLTCGHIVRLRDRLRGGLRVGDLVLPQENEV